MYTCECTIISVVLVIQLYILYVFNSYVTVELAIILNIHSVEFTHNVRHACVSMCSCGGVRLGASVMTRYMTSRTKVSVTNRFFNIDSLILRFETDMKHSVSLL